MDREQARRHYRDKHGFGGLAMTQSGDKLDAKHGEEHHKYGDTLDHEHLPPEPEESFEVYANDPDADPGL